MWTDSHCHLDALPDSALRDARDAGLSRILIPAVTGLNPDAHRLSEQDSQVSIAAGWHPLYLDMEPDKIGRRLTRLLETVPGIAAIGEIGLDYWETDAHADRQRAAFRIQLDIARDRALPVLIHLRKGFDDFLSIARQYPDIRYVMHMFGGSAEVARQLMKLLDSIWFSFGGPATRKNARHARETLHRLPLDRILLETDAPDLPPPGFPPPNVPANLPVIGKRIAEILNIPVEKLAEQTNANAGEVFRWNDSSG